jgi:hypothetical protein
MVPAGLCVRIEMTMPGRALLMAHVTDDSRDGVRCSHRGSDLAVDMLADGRGRCARCNQVRRQRYRPSADPDLGSLCDRCLVVFVVTTVTELKEAGIEWK